MQNTISYCKTKIYYAKDYYNIVNPRHTLLRNNMTLYILVKIDVI